MENLRLDCAIVFWTPEQTKRANLVEAWTGVGFEDMVPEPRTPMALLRSTLGDLYPGGHDIRSLDKRSGYAVYSVSENPDAESHSHRHVTTVKLLPDTNGVLRLVVTPFDLSLDGAIRLRYSMEADILSPAALGGGLVKIVAALKGMPLRPGGCIYWIPDASVPKWAEVASATSACGLSSSPCIYTIRHKLDRDSIKAVTDAAVADFERAAAAIKKDVESDTLGQRALENRKDLSLELLELAEFYETLLGPVLGRVKAVVAEAGEEAASAALLAMRHE